MHSNIICNSSVNDDELQTSFNLNLKVFEQLLFQSW